MASSEILRSFGDAFDGGGKQIMTKSGPVSKKEFDKGFDPKTGIINYAGNINLAKQKKGISI